MFLIILASIVMLSCGQVEDNIYDPEFNVYGVLYSEHTYQRIVVDRTYRMDEPSQPYVDSTLVIILTEGSVDTLELDSLTGKYYAWYYSIQPATTYELCVTREGFDTLHGSTNVPGNFIIQNQEFDTLTLDDSLIFTKSMGVAFYACNCGVEYGYYVEFPYWPDPDDTIESLVLGDYFYNIPSGLYPFTITACDSNYYKYNFERTDSVYSAGVTGGVGLFGSSWTVSKEFYIITE